ncbi:MFS transporter [Microbaculum marinum]|uniref:MFS transporter n=1 Tax=Microbaculum marinum TaxID=1764581 RepID=A0AAW9RR15_9HYPH
MDVAIRQWVPASRFLAWGAAELFFVLGVVVAILFAIQAPSVSGELDLSQSQLATLSGAFFLTYSIGQLALGALLGRLAPRLLLASAAIIAAIGCILFARSTSLPLAMIARVLLGCGLSVSFVGVVYVIGRDYPQRFSFMASLSQSIANLAGAAVALAASFTTALATFRAPFMVVGAMALIAAIGLLMFVGDRSKQALPARPADTAPLARVLMVCFTSLQFWMGLIYYSCLFGTVLAYGDLWNIQFQTNYFHHSTQLGAVFNAAIPLGVTVGSLVAGTWAQIRGDFVLPARVFGLIGLLVFALMFVQDLDVPLAIWSNFLIGFALAGSILGLTAVQKHLPGFARSTATAIVATAAFVLGGAIQPLVGMMVEVPASSSALFGAVLRGNPEMAGNVVRDTDFATYQNGLALLIGYVLVGFVASLFFKRPGTEQAKASPCA